MTEQEKRQAFVKALATAARISREGGIEEIELPNPETGKIELIRLDRDSARELLSLYLDTLTSQMLRDLDSGVPLDPSDREALVLWLSASNPPKNLLS